MTVLDDAFTSNANARDGIAGGAIHESSRHPKCQRRRRWRERRERRRAEVRGSPGRCA